MTCVISAVTWRAFRQLQSNAVRGFPVEDTAAMLLRFRSGALGTISISDTVAPLPGAGN